MNTNQTVSEPIRELTVVPDSFNYLDPQQFERMQKVCVMLSSSDLVPDMYRINEKNSKEKAIANCMIALEMSIRTKASPLMIMQNMYIVYGRPSFSSKFLIATVNTCGRFKPLQFKERKLGKSLKGLKYIEYEWDGVAKRKLPKEKEFTEDIEDVGVTAFTTPLKSDSPLESIEVTLSMAIMEGWYTKDGSKWKTMPMVMLRYRAASFWTNSFAPEISMGMPTVEELHDITDAEVIDVKTFTKKEASANANSTVIPETPDQNVKSEAAPVTEEAKPSETSPNTGTKPAETNKSNDNQNMPSDGPGY